MLLYELEKRNIPIYKSRATWPSTTTRKAFIVVNYVYVYILLYKVCCKHWFTLVTRSIWQCTRYSVYFFLSLPLLCFLYFVVTALQTNRHKNPLPIGFCFQKLLSFLLVVFVFRSSEVRCRNDCVIYEIRLIITN